MDRVYGMLGLATKAGKIRSGIFLTKEAITKGNAKLVVMTTDARPNTVHEIENACSYYGVPLFRYGSKEELGAKIGKSDRSCLAVTDEGFAGALTRLLEKTP